MPAPVMISPMRFSGAGRIEIERVRKIQSFLEELKSDISENSFIAEMFESMEDNIQVYLSEVVLDFIENIAASIDLCESPIEKIMYLSLCATLPSDYRIRPQYNIGKYRVDFLVTDISTNIRLAIECDGHEYHEKTKKQARRDKSRDRFIISDGIDTILRYTGSEIVNNPADCAAEVYYIYEKMKDKRCE